MLSHIPTKIVLQPQAKPCGNDVMFTTHTSCIVLDCPMECHAPSTTHTVSNLCTFILYILSVHQSPNRSDSNSRLTSSTPITHWTCLQKSL